MAKKEKVGPVFAGEDIGRRPGHPIALPSRSTNPAAPSEAKASASDSPAQIENAMVQQILERQAVFGF